LDKFSSSLNRSALAELLDEADSDQLAESLNQFFCHIQHPSNALMCQQYDLHYHQEPTQLIVWALEKSHHTALVALLTTNRDIELLFLFLA
jgi:hypothetical protein